MLAVMSAVAFISLVHAQEEDDFISISPVEQKETGSMMDSGAVEAREVKPAVTPEKKDTAPTVRTAAVSTVKVDKILALDFNDRVEVRVITSAKVVYKATELSPPPNHRILAQLSNCSVNGGTISFGKGGVSRIRSAQHGSTAWIVVDLDSKMRWKTRNDGNTIVIEVPKAVAQARVAEQPETYVPPSSGMLYRIVDVAGKNLGKKTRIIVTADGPVKYRVKKDSAGMKIILNVLEAVSIWKKGSLEIGEGAVTSVIAKENAAAKSVDISMGLNENMPFTVVRDQNQIVIDIDNPENYGKRPRKKLDLYQRISINIQDANLPGVLRLLSTQTGFEFSVSPAVATAKPVTIRHDEQPLDQVLRDILIPQGLFYEVDEGIIKIGTISELKTAKQLRKKRAKFYYPRTMKASDLKTLLDVQVNKEPLLDVALQVDTSQGNNRLMVVGTNEDVDKVMSMISSVDAGGSTEDDGSYGGGLKTKVYKLQYIKPSAIESKLKSFMSADGKVEVDDRSGNLIITDSAGYLKKVEAVIKKLDIKLKQVLIEAKLYEINVGAMKNVGVKWTGESQDNNPHIIGDVSGIPVGSTAAGQLFVGMLQNGIRIDATLSALESNNKASLLSSPKIAVGDNQSATIDTTRTTYYEKTTIQEQANSAPLISKSYESIELPITLVVSAKITDSNSVIMDVDVTVTKILGAVTGTAPPDTTKQKATTQITASNNETVVIGGLITERITIQEDKVPILGDLPLLGNLFKGTKDQKEKVELVVFLTPSIVED